MVTIDLRGARKFLGRLGMRKPKPVFRRGRAGAADDIARLKRELDEYKAEAAVITATPEAMLDNAEKASDLRSKISANKYCIGQLEFVIALMDLNDEYAAALERKLVEMANADGDVCKKLDTAAGMARVKEKLEQAKFVAEAMEAADPYNVWDVAHDMSELRFTVDESNKEWHISHTLEYIFNRATIELDGRPSIVDRIQA